MMFMEADAGSSLSSLDASAIAAYATAISALVGALVLWLSRRAGDRELVGSEQKAVLAVLTTDYQRVVEDRDRERRERLNWRARAISAEGELRDRNRDLADRDAELAECRATIRRLESAAGGT